MTLWTTLIQGVVSLAGSESLRYSSIVKTGQALGDDSLWYPEMVTSKSVVNGEFLIFLGWNDCC